MSKPTDPVGRSAEREAPSSEQATPCSDDLIERVAKAFHEAYERLAPEYAYETRKASAVPWEYVPSLNRQLMIATVGEVLPVAQAPLLEQIERLEADRDSWREIAVQKREDARTRIAELEEQLESSPASPPSRESVPVLLDPEDAVAVLLQARRDAGSDAVSYIHAALGELGFGIAPAYVDGLRMQASHPYLGDRAIEKYRDELYKVIDQRDEALARLLVVEEERDLADAAFDQVARERRDDLRELKEVQEELCLLYTSPSPRDS